MSKHLKKIKNPFQCKDCKTFCTSDSRLLQFHREKTCAYAKRRRELLEKNYNINGRKKKPASASSPTIVNSRIIPTTLVSPIDLAANNSSISYEMRHMNKENDRIGNSYDQPDDSMDSPNFDMSPPNFHPEDNDLTCHQNQYRKWQEKVSELLYNKGNTSNSRTPNSNNSSNQNSFHGLARYLKLGWTYDINMEKKRGKPNTSDLLELFAYTKANWLSVSGGDGLLLLIRNFVARHPTKENVFLYKNMSSINVAVARAVNQLYTFYDYNTILPTILKGSNNNEKRDVKRILDHRNLNHEEYIIAKGNGLNIIQIISENLLTINSNEIDLEPVIQYDPITDERVYSRFATGDFFFHICDRVKNIYGENVVPIVVQLGYDATDISGGGGSAPKSATPINVRILNASDNIFGLKKSTMLTGFAPLFTVSIKKLHM